MATINVPFIGEENIVRACSHKGRRRKNVEDLIREEFGSLDAACLDFNLRTDSAVSTSGPAPVHKNRAAKDRQVLSTRYNRAKQILEVEIYGPLSKQAREELPSLLQMIEQHRPRKYEIDMARCPEIRSSGLGLLLLLKEAMTASAGGIRLINCSAQVQELLSWAGIEA